MSISNYALTCDTTVDLTPEHLERLGVSYAKYYYILNGVEYPDDLGQTRSYKEFYHELRNGATTSTAQANSSDFLELFTPFLEAGRDILHIGFSSGLSGGVNSARNAAAIALERYPERKIYVVDSLCASSGYGLFVDKLASLRDGGMGIDELRDWALENRLRVNHWFFSTDLSFYIRGGRVSRVAGTIGGILGICPLLNMDYLGRLIPRAKVPGKRRVIHEQVRRMELLADNGFDYNEKCYICHSDCLEDAQTVAEMVQERFPKLDGSVLINDIGTTIGSHTGPGTVSLFFWGQKRID